MHKCVCVRAFGEYCVRVEVIPLAALQQRRRRRREHSLRRVPTFLNQLRAVTFRMHRILHPACMHALAPECVVCAGVVPLHECVCVLSCSDKETHLGVINAHTRKWPVFVVVVFVERIYAMCRADSFYVYVYVTHVHKHACILQSVVEISVTRRQKMPLTSSALNAHTRDTLYIPIFYLCVCIYVGDIGRCRLLQGKRQTWWCVLLGFLS